MSVTEKIIQYLKDMPESVQVEVLNFGEYLNSKIAGRKQTQDETDWSTFSLSHAMRDMEDDQTSYSLRDLKEVFS